MSKNRVGEKLACKKKIHILTHREIENLEIVYRVKKCRM